MARARDGGQGRGSGSLLWLQGLACGGMAALAPLMTAHVVALLAPGAVALLFERQAGRPVARAMLLFGLAASVEPICLAWRSAGAPVLDRLPDPGALTLPWAAAALGWLLAEVAPLLMRITVEASEQARAERLRGLRAELVRTWGLEGEDEADAARPGEADGVA